LPLVGKQISTCQENLKPQHVGNALYGLQSMSSEWKEVRGMLPLVGKQISTCQENLKPQHVGNALYGLQSMSSEWKEVRGLLPLVGKQISTCQGNLKPQHVGNALYGLQSMNSEWKEVRGLLPLVGKQIATCQENLDAQAVGNALYGLRNISIDTHMISFVMQLLEKIDDFNSSNCTTRYLSALYQSLALVDDESCQFVQSLQGHGLYKGMVKQKERLFEVLRDDPNSLNNNAVNASQRRYAALTEKYFGSYKDIKVTYNEYLEGFEADIVIRKQLPNGKTTAVLNIELDGPVHKIPRKMKFCDLRDEHLKTNYDVRVVRWDLVSNTLMRMKQSEKAQLFHDVLHDEFSRL